MGAFGVVDCGFDLATMADDRGVLEKALHVLLSEFGDAVAVEAMENAAEVLALGEDGPPAQAGLKSLEADFLKQTLVVRDGEAPFGIVIADVFRRDDAPAAAWLAVRAGD